MHVTAYLAQFVRFTCLLGVLHNPQERRTTKHYAATNADGFQGDAWGETPAQALETIIRDSSGPADAKLLTVHQSDADYPDLLRRMAEHDPNNTEDAPW